MSQTVLIVDDHACFRGFARRLLRAVLTPSREAAGFGQRPPRTSARGFIHKDELSGTTLGRLAEEAPRVAVCS